MKDLIHYGKKLVLLGVGYGMCPVKAHHDAGVKVLHRIHSKKKGSRASGCKNEEEA